MHEQKRCDRLRVRDLGLDKCDRPTTGEYVRSDKLVRLTQTYQQEVKELLCRCAETAKQDRRRMDKPLPCDGAVLHFQIGGNQNTLPS